MPSRISIVGQRFDRLTVVSERGPAGQFWGTPQNRQVEVRCDCGNVKVTSARAIRRGRTTSCGCRGRELRTTHGLSSHPLYVVLSGMKARCYNPDATTFPSYGARGIGICDEWRGDPAAFVAWGEANGYRHGLEINRRDNDGDYAPSNCEFVTPIKNARNKSDNRIVEFRGRSLTLADLAEESGIKYDVLIQRVGKLGWTVERAASTPVRACVRRA